MKLNGTTKIIGEKVVLVPYRTHHVKKYNEWMKCKELSKLTASEPLTLEQEYEMQLSWSCDEEKLTFIVLDKEIYEQQKDDVAAMVGDINLFLNSETPEMQTGELSMMIAEKSARGKGFGKEAVLIFLRYASKYLSIRLYEAKIFLDNDICRSLLKSVHFKQKCVVKVFEEEHFELNVDDKWLEWLKQVTKSYTVEKNYQMSDR